MHYDLRVISKVLEYLSHCVTHFMDENSNSYANGRMILEVTDRMYYTQD
jgi:hypothetical protein